MIRYFVVFAFFTVQGAARATQLAGLDALLKSAIQQKVFPGVVALVSYKGKIIYHKALGHYTYDTQSPAVTRATLFDLASLTKPFATVATMLLCDAGALSLDDPVCKYLPEFAANGKEDVRVKHLLLHTSGICDDVFFKDKTTLDESLRKLFAYRPVCLPGERHIYSDLNTIILQCVIEAVSGTSFDAFVAECITKPLGMRDTLFNPLNTQRCAPTGDNQGRVHDDQAYILGGVAGHAGLFSTAGDLAKLMRALLHSSFVKPEIIALWTRDQAFRWGYGWEVGRHLSKDAFGYFGWTGTSVWVDKEHDLYCILLTNRTMVGSGPDNSAIRVVRVAFHEFVVKALGLPAFITPPVPVHE